MGLISGANFLEISGLRVKKNYQFNNENLLAVMLPFKSACTTEKAVDPSRSTRDL